MFCNVVGPTREDPVPDPLAVLRLDNRLYMSPVSPVIQTEVTVIKDVKIYNCS